MLSCPCRGRRGFAIAGSNLKDEKKDNGKGSDGKSGTSKSGSSKTDNSKNCGTKGKSNKSPSKTRSRSRSGSRKRSGSSKKCSPVRPPAPPSYHVCLNENSTTYSLLDGTKSVGSLHATVAGGNLTVTFTTSSPFKLASAHLWVGTDIDELPRTDCGYPRWSVFPYSQTPSDLGRNATSTSFTISLSSGDTAFSCPGTVAGPPKTLVFVGHAAVVRGQGSQAVIETAFSQGTVLNDNCGGRCGNNASYSTLTLNCCQDTPTKPTKTQPKNTPKGAGRGRNDN